MSERRLNILWILIVIGIVVAVIAFNRNSMDSQLVGVWKLEWTQMNGMPQRRERELWVFQEGELRIVRDKGEVRTKFAVDPNKSPKHLDTDLLFQSAGIYEIDGDTLRISQAVREMPRPEGFATTRYDLCTILVLRRLNADPRLPIDELQALLITEFGPPTTYPERIKFDKDAERFVEDFMRHLDSNPEEGTKEYAFDCVADLIGEVNNGGFNQFFFNSAGDHAMNLPPLLRKIDAPETANLVEQACALFPKGVPSKDIQERRAQLEKFSLDQHEALSDLDERFYSRREDLHWLLKEYWNRTP